MEVRYSRQRLTIVACLVFSILVALAVPRLAARWDAYQEAEKARHATQESLLQKNLRLLRDGPRLPLHLRPTKGQDDGSEGTESPQR